MKKTPSPRPKGDEARREMDDLLRTLGSRNGLVSRHSDQPVDTQRGLRESHDSGPPAEYIEQFDAFQQGTKRREVNSPEKMVGNNPETDENRSDSRRNSSNTSRSGTFWRRSTHNPR